MKKAPEVASRFLYNGHALAAGGRITRPYCENIEPQASMVLPIVGGYGHARVENYRFRDVISFRAASSTVTGNESSEAEGEAAFNTLATVTVEGLDIAGVVTADKVVARLVSKHTGGKSELPIHPTGSYFQNLRLLGVEVAPRAHDALFRGTLVEVRDGLKGQKLLGLDGGPLDFSSGEAHTLTSLYERPGGLPTGCTAEGPWGIRIAGFGVVYLGEIVLSHGQRRLTMIRVQMGSPTRGDVVVGIVGGNGTTHP